MLTAGKIASFFLVCVLVFSACAAQPVPLADLPVEEAKHRFFNTFPQSGGIVFIGAAARRRNPADTLRFAVEDAARRAAIFHRITGEYAVENNIGGGIFDFSHDTFMSIQYDPNAARKFVNDLHFCPQNDTLEIANTLFVRTVLSVQFPQRIEFQIEYAADDGRPSWVDSPPLTIGGFEAGVGFSGRHSTLATTFTNSFNNAVFAIIRNINTVVHSTVNVGQATGSLFGHRVTTANIVYSFGTLQYFYVLDTWIDPSNNTVWTLAIAKKADN